MGFSPKPNVMPTKVSIFDGGGKLVREMDLVGPALAEAQNGSVTWDGLDAEGKKLPSGKYTFRVQGVGQDGQGQELSTELSGRVTGVDMEGQTPMLVLETASGKQRMELSKINSVSVGENANASANSARQVAAPGSAPANATNPTMTPMSVPVPQDGDAEEAASEDGERPSMADTAAANMLPASPGAIPNSLLQRLQP
jgi:hypothetical protein